MAHRGHVAFCFVFLVLLLLIARQNQTGNLLGRACWTVAYVVSVDDNGCHGHFLRWPLEDMPHFVLFCFLLLSLLLIAR